MDDFEKHLREELRPISPPAGFVDGIVASVHRAQRRRARRLSVLLLGVLFITAGLGPAVWKRYEERRQEEAAKQQFALAMRITGKTLSLMEERVNRAGVREYFRTNEVEQ